MLNLFSRPPRRTGPRSTRSVGPRRRVSPTQVPEWAAELSSRYGVLALVAAIAVGAMALVLTASSESIAPLQAGTTSMRAHAGALASAPDPAPARIVAPAETSIAVVEVAASQPLALTTNYEVQPGDTIRSIAEQFGVSSQTIMWANELENPDLIEPGQSLIVPSTSGVLYQADGTESLGELAERFQGNPETISAYNQLDLTAEQIVPAGEILIPDGQRIDYSIADEPAADVELAQAEEAQVSALGETTALPVAIEEEVVEPLAIPDPIVYEVRDGDTLKSLALLFGVSVETLLNANNIDDPDMVTVGTTLRVLPISGVEYTVADGETMVDIAGLFEVDGGAIADANGVRNPDLIQAGDVLIIPGATDPNPVRRVPEEYADEGSDTIAESSGDVEYWEDESEWTDESEWVADPEPPDYVYGGGDAIVENAMAHLGQPYVWGGVGPYGFDCSGFVYYVHSVSGHPVDRGLWGQLNGGPSIGWDDLQPGDAVFFANTYTAGLSHAGIYIGGGSFIHASDPSTGVVISSMYSDYWSSRFVGASRLW